ncbi:MAG: alpha-N-arabinofuranosidase, partial [Arcticibacterium sp.]
VNIDMNKSHKISLDLRGENFTSLSGRILKANTVQEHNTFENPKKVTVKNYSGAELIDNKINMDIPPFSVIVIKLN